MSNDDYDPGPLYEPPSYRRRRRRGEHDDAWAAADEDDFYDDDVEIEDLAAGYVWDDERRKRDHTLPTPDPTPDPTSDGWHDGARWNPSVERSRERGRLSGRSRRERGERYTRGDVYGRSPSYYRDRMKRGEYGEYRADATKTKRNFSPYDSSPGLNLGLNIPFWQILIIVILALFSLVAVALACMSVLLL